MPPLGQLIDPKSLINWIFSGLDLALVFGLTYLLLLMIGRGERRIMLVVRGMIVLVTITFLSNKIGFVLLSFVLDKLLIGCAVAMVVIFQTEFRRFLENLGRGDLGNLLTNNDPSLSISVPIIDGIFEAVEELSRNRTGALIVLETTPIDKGVFKVPGIAIDAEVSKELLMTIFHVKTPLHDGAVIIRGSRIASAATILPLSDKTASRQLGTRHRAAMGITERVEDCICIVVSEETGSISLAERGSLNRPITISTLKIMLEERFSPCVEREVVTSGLSNTVDWLKQRQKKLFKFLSPLKKKK